MFDKLEDLLVRFDEILNELDRAVVFDDIHAWLDQHI